tara:strand:- start:137 stop:913 length:777 start_codon:yes stop_codon:yes gene_type:complete
MIYISPPFGNYISLKDCYSVAGTYTYFRRKGLIKQVLKTLRPVKGGWRNSIGLRNKGIININFFKSNTVYSICALKYSTTKYNLLPNVETFLWDSLLEQIPSYCMVELNVGCPNVGNISDITDNQIKNYVNKFKKLTIKLPPTTSIDKIKHLHSLGIKNFHLSNTLLTDRYTDNGIIKCGVSGYPLKKKNLPLVEKVANINLKDTHIIAGGGIYKPQDVIEYHNAGATDYSLSTIFLTPWKVCSVIKEIKRKSKTCNT